MLQWMHVKAGRVLTLLVSMQHMAIIIIMNDKSMLISLLGMCQHVVAY